MVVAGIDLSSHAIDVVMLNLDDDHAEWWRYELEGRDLIERVRSAYGFRYWRPWMWEDCLSIGIERPAGRYGVPQVSMVFGAVVSSLPARLAVKPWQPAEWKRACGLRGNATKLEVLVWSAAKRSPDATLREGWAQDACDAYAIAYATRAVTETEEAA